MSTEEVTLNMGNTGNIKLIIDMIKPFTGEGELIFWLKKVKLLAKLQNISDLACFLRFLPPISGGCFSNLLGDERE